VLRALLGGLRVAPEATRLEPLGEREDPAGAGCHPTRSAYLVRSDLDVEEAALGVVGEIDPALLIALGCAERRVGWLALDLDAFLALPEADVRARPVSTFPSSDLDLAFVLDDAVRAIGVEERLRAAAGDLLESVTLVDVYRGPSVPKGTRNLTYRLRLVALDRTLGGEEISAVRTTCIDAVCTELPARLRE
jgi:phenylalanyl-tRNA synthetase beta chain